jgi:hypothetical protein
MNCKPDAYTFLCDFAKKKRNRIDAWPPCLVIDLARLQGIEFADDRKWGPVFDRARKDGVIKRGGLFPRESSNGSMRPGWLGC